MSLFKYSMGTIACLAAFAGSVSAQSMSGDINQAQFNQDGSVLSPAGYREWIFVGAPFTPNVLNEGAAPFPEFHNVYVEPSAYAYFAKTGEWAEGTQIAKELVMVREGDSCNETNGACSEVSGIGYFQGEFVGLELTVKDNSRFGNEPGGWAYFSFGHAGEPYAATAEAFPAESCNACHAANAETDFVFTQFYPILRAFQKME